MGRINVMAIQGSQSISKTALVSAQEYMFTKLPVIQYTAVNSVKRKMIIPVGFFLY